MLRQERPLGSTHEKTRTQAKQTPTSTAAAATTTTATIASSTTIATATATATTVASTVATIVAAIDAFGQRVRRFFLLLHFLVSIFVATAYFDFGLIQHPRLRNYVYIYISVIVFIFLLFFFKNSLLSARSCCCHIFSRTAITLRFPSII
jgi:hypothetical protein